MYKGTHLLKEQKVHKGIHLLKVILHFLKINPLTTWTYFLFCYINCWNVMAVLYLLIFQRIRSSSFLNVLYELQYITLSIQIQALRWHQMKLNYFFILQNQQKITKNVKNHQKMTIVLDFYWITSVAIKIQ